jgi:hypothetical protein
MAKARPVSELNDAISTAFQVVDSKIPLLIPAAQFPVAETERVDRMNLRQTAFGLILKELLDNEYE